MLKGALPKSAVRGKAPCLSKETVQVQALPIPMLVPSSIIENRKEMHLFLVFALSGLALLIPHAEAHT